MSDERGTQTSRFGSRGRISHDASYFYGSRMYSDQPEEQLNPAEIENPLPEGVLDQILVASSEKMSDLPDACLHLICTPYRFLLICCPSHRRARAARQPDE